MTIANVNIRRVLLKRGNTIQSNSYTGPIGEVTMDTDIKTIRVHDGLTAGGHLIPTQANMQSYANVAVASGLAAVNANVSALTANVTALTSSATAANTAMKSYVDSQITSIVGGAPTVLDTLGEIATALNNDANVAATLTNSIAAVNGNVANLTTNVSSINSDVVNLTTNVSSIASDITTINNALANIVVPNLQAVTTDIIPATDIAYDIGSSTNRFRDIYLSTNTIYLGTNAVSIDDSGQLIISESYQGGEGVGDIASVEWTTSGNLEIRTSDTSSFVAKFDSLKNGDTFELLTGSVSFPAGTVVTVNGTVTKTLTGSGDYYDFVIPVDVASQSNVYVYNFTLTKSPLTDVSQLNDTGSLLLSNSISDTDGVDTFSIDVSSTGVVTMSTARGGLEFGAMPEEGAPQHLHIMRPAGQEGATDLYFGDDYNYVKMPGSYGPGTQGVEIGSSYNSGNVSIWRFGTDGNLTLPGGGSIDGSDYDVDITAGNDGVSTFGHISFTANGPNGLNSLTYNSLGEITVVTAGANDGLIKWVGNSSGDGAGYTTMTMVPDTTREGTDQYLIVDPTGGEPGHIHIRAGGTQDSSAADLYLGGELTCLRVSDTSGIVTVRTTNIGNPNITMDWRFERDGNLYFPGIGNNGIGESEPGLVVSSDNSVVLQSNNTGESKELLFGTDGNLTLPSNGYLVVTSGLATTGASPAPTISGFSITNSVGISGNGNISGGDITATGNVSATSFIGDGSQLTGLPASYGDSDVATFLAAFGSNSISTTGNITAGNISGNISITGNVTGTSANVELVAGSYTWTFDNTGLLTLPAMGGDEGGEINFVVPATNTTLVDRVKFDVYQDRIRFFDGSTKGAYIDLSQAATGVGTLLNNRIAALVNAGSFVTMDNIKATVTTSGNRGLSLATVSGTFVCNIGGTYGLTGSGSGGQAGTLTVTTTASGSVFGWGFFNQGDTSTYIITDTTNNIAYRITLQIGNGYNNNMISIERLI